MTAIIPSTGSCQVLTSEASVTQPVRTHAPVPLLRMIQPCDPSPFPVNHEEKEKPMLEHIFVRHVRDCPVTRWSPGAIPGRPRDLPPPRRVCPKSVSSAICAPVISLPDGSTRTAMPSARWMPPSSNAMSPDSRDTVPATSPKRPRASAISVRFLQRQGVVHPRHADAPPHLSSSGLRSMTRTLRTSQA